MAIILPCMATLAANSANSGILKGRILDNEKKPLPGAVIVLDDNQQSIIADADGFYSFANLPSGKHNLEVSYIGYVPVSRSVSVVESPVTADIVMADTSTELNEVVVTGAQGHQCPKEQSEHHQHRVGRPDREISGLEHRRRTEKDKRNQRAVRPGRSTVRSGARHSGRVQFSNYKRIEASIGRRRHQKCTA